MDGFSGVFKELAQFSFTAANRFFRALAVSNIVKINVDVFTLGYRRQIQHVR